MATNPFTWTPYTAPKMTPTAGAGFHEFYRPSDSKLPTGQALTDYLTNNGANPGGNPSRAVKVDGGLTREMLGNTTGFLNDQMGKGFGDLTSFITDMGQYGGAFGDKNSPVYSPQSQNGYGQGWGGSNPFKIGSF